MKFGIVVFPGTWSDRDTKTALDRIDGVQSDFIWHKQTDLGDCDAVVLPGGFSYGDYLRAGAIARFSPVVEAVIEFARAGGIVIGVCNGFQILCEAGLLPGLLIRNSKLQFRCQWTNLLVANRDSRFTRAIPADRRTLKIPISHGEGNYIAEPAELERLRAEGRIIFQYASADGDIDAGANPNGSALNIAGIMNSNGNVLGMMPHPERACEPLLGGEDGLFIFKSVCATIGAARA